MRFCTIKCVIFDLQKHQKASLDFARIRYSGFPTPRWIKGGTWRKRRDGEGVKGKRKIGKEKTGKQKRKGRRKFIPALKKFCAC